MWEETSNENESSKSSILEESDSAPSNRSEKGSKMEAEEQDQLQIDNTYQFMNQNESGMMVLRKPQFGQEKRNKFGVLQNNSQRRMTSQFFPSAAGSSNSVIMFS